MAYPKQEPFTKEADAKARAADLARHAGVSQVAIYELRWAVTSTSDVQFIAPGAAVELSK
jgi:hypothetical protein